MLTLPNKYWVFDAKPHPVTLEIQIHVSFWIERDAERGESVTGRLVKDELNSSSSLDLPDVVIGPCDAKVLEEGSRTTPGQEEARVDA